MAGVLYDAVRGDELFPIHSAAPRPGFSLRDPVQFDAMARGARLTA